VARIHHGAATQAKLAAFLEDGAPTGVLKGGGPRGRTIAGRCACSRAGQRTIALEPQASGRCARRVTMKTRRSDGITKANNATGQSGRKTTRSEKRLDTGAGRKATPRTAMAQVLNAVVPSRSPRAT
jgi:hypothetical protein